MIGAEGGDNATAKVMVVVAKTNENNMKFMMNSKKKRKKVFWWRDIKNCTKLSIYFYITYFFVYHNTHKILYGVCFLAPDLFTDRI